MLQEYCNEHNICFDSINNTKKDTDEKKDGNVAEIRCFEQTSWCYLDFIGKVQYKHFMEILHLNKKYATQLKKQSLDKTNVSYCIFWG